MGIKKSILNWEDNMQLPYSNFLDIAHFSRLLDNKSECYKLFWFQAIARKIKAGNKIITFEALIDEMIADKCQSKKFRLQQEIWQC